MENTCPVCEAQSFKLIGEKLGETYYRCRSCGVAIGLDFWNSAERSGEAMYDESYLAKSGEMHPKTTQRYHEFLDFIEERVEEKNLVEVGFGNGQFLLAANERNWNTLGVEISSAACKYATDELNLKTLCGMFEEVPIEPDSVDAVASMETIEHLYDPKGFLDRCYYVLKPGGILFLTTPNEKCLTRKLIGMEWRGYYPGHTILYPYNVLKVHLKDCGFSVIGGETRTIIPRTIINVYKHRLKTLLKNQKPFEGPKGNISLAEAQSIRDRIDASASTRLLKVLVNSFLNLTKTGEKTIIFAKKQEKPY